MKAYINENNVVVAIGENDSLYQNCTYIEITEVEKIFIENCRLPKIIDGTFIDDYEGVDYSSEVIIVPQEISRMKFKIQLRRSTIYSHDIILEYLRNLPINEFFTQETKEYIIDRLEDAVNFNRYHKDFITIANMLGVSDKIKDEIFIQGNKIE